LIELGFLVGRKTVVVSRLITAAVGTVAVRTVAVITVAIPV
jgi:hypothetical protein